MVLNAAPSARGWLIAARHGGSCPGFDMQTTSLESKLTSVGFTTDDWDEFMDVMENGTQAEQTNDNCWMQNYLMQCTTCPSCPDKDPFAD